LGVGWSIGHRRRWSDPLRNLKGHISKMIIEQNLLESNRGQSGSTSGVHNSLAARGLIA
jgi:hypothetical protein